jgi:hypothetical protein
MSCSVAVLPAASVLAQENSTTLTNNGVPSSLPHEPGWEAGVNSGYVGGSSTKFQGRRLGNSDAFNVNVEASTRIPLSEAWFLNVKLAVDNFFFDQVAGEPIPSAVNTLRLNAGVGWRLDDQWTVTGLLSPSLYRFEDAGQNDLGIAGGVLAAYQMRPSLTWKMGLLVAPDSDLKVFPVLGVHWAINDNYTLDVGVPKTRLTYNLAANWNVYGGADLNGTTFRTGNDLGTKTGNPRYNDALATYRDIRLGMGIGYELVHGIRAEVEAGYSVYREINYTHIDTTVRFNPAPYVRLGLIAKF